MSYAQIILGRHVSAGVAYGALIPADKQWMIGKTPEQIAAVYNSAGRGGGGGGHGGGHGGGGHGHGHGGNWGGNGWGWDGYVVDESWRCEFEYDPRWCPPR